MFTPIDIFFVLVILVFALMALAKGFVKELFGKASVIVGIGVAFMFYERLSVYVLPYIKNVLLAKILSFLVILTHYKGQDSGASEVEECSIMKI